jgi:hypothetical protein
MFAGEPIQTPEKKFLSLPKLYDRTINAFTGKQAVGEQL